jgi:hypothetical protein
VAEETLLTIALSAVTDQFKVLKNGNTAGHVYRLMAGETVPVYDSPGPGANIMRRLKPGVLLVGFNDPGPLRQVCTIDQTFGYIKRTWKLVPVGGIDPEGLYDPEKRAAFESGLPSPEEMLAAYTAEQSRTKRNQQYFMIGFVAFILLGIMTTVLLHSPAVPVK